MIIKLTIEERINLIQGLPASGGDKETQRSYRSVKKNIELTDKEAETIGYRVLNDGRITWNDKEQKALGFEFTPIEAESLKAYFNARAEQSSFPAWGVDIDDQLEAELDKGKEKAELKKA